MTTSYGKQITNGGGIEILLVDRAVESTEVFRIISPTRGTATELVIAMPVELVFRCSLCTRPAPCRSARSRVVLRKRVEGNVTSPYTMHRGRGRLGCHEAGEQVGESKCGEGGIRVQASQTGRGGGRHIAPAM